MILCLVVILRLTSHDQPLEKLIKFDTMLLELRPVNLSYPILLSDQITILVSSSSNEVNEDF
jgi:hypothetical protein